MRIYKSLLIALWVVSSCTEDISREISTDLTVEATQFFQFSRAISESNYLGNIFYPDYFRINSDELPGCPTIVRGLGSRIIVLDYSNTADCEEELKKERSGKIILDFSLSNSSDPTWSLQYDDYFFDGIKIKGRREFKALASNETEGSFENLEIELPQNQSFLVSGKFNHSVSRSSFRPFALSTRGNLSGRNPVGRNFELTITKPKEQLFACYRDGWDLTQTGEEAWEISRGGNSVIAYSTRFETNIGCNPLVISILPDGRTYQLNL